MGDFRTRFTTAIIGLIILLFVLYQGGIFLGITVLAVSLLAIYEMRMALKRININLIILPLILGIISIYSLKMLNLNIFISVIIVFFICAITFLFTDKSTLIDTATTLMMFLYIPLNLSLLLNLDKTPFLYLVFIIAFSTDTFAYFIGSKFGKVKLLEAVSPHKSVEGFIGGILGCILCSILYFAYIKYSINILTIIFIVFASVLGQFGDLTASKIKRLAGIKDYSNLLPGHGGMLDRIDSLLFIIPLIFSMLNVMNNL